MATLTADTPRVFESGPDDLKNDLPVVASDIIYDGAAVGDNGSGYARPLVAGDPFMGIAYFQADNSSGSAGDVNVRLKQRGVVTVSVVGATGVGDQGDDVYAADDDTFTKTVGSNTKIGKIMRWVSGTTCQVYFEATAVQSI